MRPTLIHVTADTDTGQAAPPRAGAPYDERPPLVSVIVPAWNAGEYLRPAVESVLAQTHRELEVIVVDDGSTDGSPATLADIGDPRLRVVHQENAGKSAAMNRGIAESRGELFAVQDSDDLSDPRRIEQQARLLAGDPALTGAFVGVRLLMDDRPTAPQSRAKDAERCRRDLAGLHLPAHDGPPMFRRSAVGALRFDEDVRIGETIDLVLRLDEAGGAFAVVGECLYSYRLRPGSLCHDDPDARDAEVGRVLARARERRGMPPADGAPRVSGSRNAARDNNIASYFIESAIDQRAAGHLGGAITTGLRCARMHPLDPHYWKALVCAIAPRGLLRRMRRSERAA